MRILCLDIASTTGWAILDDQKLKDYGLIHTDERGNRIKYLIDEVTKLLRQFRPKLVLIEDIYMAGNVKSYKLLAMLHAAAFLSARRYRKNIEVLVSPAIQIRSLLNIRGSGRTEIKKNVVTAVNKRFNKKIKSNDEADAIAIGWAFTKDANIFHEF